MRYKEKPESPEFFKIAGNQYFFDLDELSQFIRIEKNESVDDILGENKEENNKEPVESVENQIIDITKWETAKVMIECVLNETGPIDEAMGITKLGEQLSIPFRLSFNTLLNYKIIKEQYGR